MASNNAFSSNKNLREIAITAESVFLGPCKNQTLFIQKLIEPVVYDQYVVL